MSGAEPKGGSGGKMHVCVRESGSQREKEGERDELERIKYGKSIESWERRPSLSLPAGSRCMEVDMQCQAKYTRSLRSIKLEGR